MSLLQNLINENKIYFYSDFRKGSYIEETGKDVTVHSSTYLNNKGMCVAPGVTNTYTLTRGSEADIGTKDFTVLTRFRTSNNGTARAAVGLGLGTATNNCMPFLVDNLTDGIGIKFGTSYFWSADVIASNITTNYAITCDRDGDATYFKEGIKKETNDISARVGADIVQANYSVGSLGNNNWGLNGLVEYALLIDGCLTETEVAQLTAELENRQFPKIVTSKAFTRADGYVFDGTTDFGTITEPIYVDYTKDFSYEYYWKVGSPSAIKSLFGSVIVPGEDYYGSDYFGQSESSFCFKIYDLTVGVVQSINMTYNFIEDATYKMMCSYDATTKILTGTRINLDTGVDNKTATVDLTGNNFYFKLNLLGQRGSSDRLMDGNVYDLQLTTDGKTHYVTRDAIMNTPKPTHIYVKDDVAFKTDWGVTANNTAITSGFIENTPFEVQSGSFKVIDDTYNGKSVKAIECVTDGDFKLNQNLDGTAWQLYKDTGSGYETSDGTGIIVGNVFSLTAGDKIILSDISGNNSINKK